MPEIVPIEIIENKIYIIRSQKVMLDSDLAELYDVETKVLNQAVKRNIERFPDDFMFPLTNDEWDVLRSQFVTSNNGKGGRRYTPYVFTEQGVSMLSSVINSKRAIAINIHIMRVFVKIRQIALENKDLASQLNELESRFIEHAKDNSIEQQEQNEKINKILKCLHYLEDRTKPSKIGFKTDI